MGAQNPVSSLAHSYLDTFAEMLHKLEPDRALEKFSNLIEGKKLDVVSANALFFVAHPTTQENLKEELLSRTHQTKRQLDFSAKNFTQIASQRLRNKTVMAHPLGTVSAFLLRSADKVRFIQAGKQAIGMLPNEMLEAHQPLTAHAALENADLLLLEPSAVTEKGFFVERGGMMLAELAKAMGIPVYAAATSWHTAPKWSPSQSEERIPPEYITGVLSEHGIYGHEEFLSRVEKAFPWIL
jgi:translation initiation factor 2B subunit (eIF-2B alpha/beta/delta family)